jgi:hypothetical protein
MSEILDKLIVLYGRMGAREKFQTLVEQLIKSDIPTASTVRVVQGDGGIDVHVGDLTDPAGIDIYQIKYFPDGVGDAQKNQIRDSFKTVATSTDFRCIRWMLCLPRDMSVEEKSWFEGWRQKQTVIEIANPWGAMELLHLLTQDKNRGIKEHIFHEEHLTKIDDFHQALVPAANDEQRKRDENAADSQRMAVIERLDSLSTLQFNAVTAYRRTQMKGQLFLGNWRLAFYPSVPQEATRLGELWNKVVSCRSTESHDDFPHCTEKYRVVRGESVGIDRELGLNNRYWRLTIAGQFVAIDPIHDDIHCNLNDRARLCSTCTTEPKVSRSLVFLRAAESRTVI